mmetsp:Transcript_956/g.2382  ORF Transcript_956/g.2382 Transcript_956/m.2382 type:complete len:266 (-) Transcript_956:22-819(-)
MAGGQPPPQYGGQPYAAEWDDGSRKRPRGEAAGPIDTLVLLGQTEKGFTDRQLEDFFRQLNGFVAFKSSARVGGGFVKFASPELAGEAMELAAQSGIEAQFARSSMNTGPDLGAGAGAGAHVYPAGQPPPPSYPCWNARGYENPVDGLGGPPMGMGMGFESHDGHEAAMGLQPMAMMPPKRARTEDPETIDTLVLLGQTEKGFTEQQLEEFFRTVPGFIAWKRNPRVGGGFVKFASPQLARDAIDTAAASGIEAQVARSSMSKAS